MKSTQRSRIFSLGISVEIYASNQINNLPVKLKITIMVVNSFSQIDVPLLISSQVIPQFSSENRDTARAFMSVEPDVSGILSEFMSAPLKSSYYNVSCQDTFDHIGHTPLLSPRQLSNRSMLCLH